MTSIVKDTATSRLAARIQRVKSTSGVEAWVVEDHSRPMLCVSFAFRGGALLDPDGKPCAMALMGDLLTEGSGHLGGEAFQLALSDSAIELHIESHRDHVRGTMRVLEAEAGRAFELLALALQKPEFGVDAFARHRDALRSDLSMSMADPANVANDVFVQRAMPGHPYGLSVEDKLASLETLTVDDVRACYQTSMTRADLVVAVVGSMKAGAVAAMLDQVFGALPAGSPFAEPQTTIHGLGDTLPVRMPSPQTAIAFGRPGLASTDPDFASAIVIAHALGGGFHSRLNTELREKRGLCYSIQAGLDVPAGAALLVGGTTVANASAAEAVRLIRHEFRTLIESGLTDAEIEGSKGFLSGSMQMQLNSSMSVARLMLDMQLRRRGTDWLEQRITNIANVTRESTTRTLPRLLGDGAILVAMAGAD